MVLKWLTRGRTEYSLDRGLMAPRSRPGIRLLLVAFLVATIAWHATARADDILDRSVSFHIASSPLSSALIDFSTQSGLQVAAADADVSHMQSKGVTGTYPPRVALDLLLHGTGLRFTRVGAATVAISAVTKPTAAASIGTGGSGAVAQSADARSPQPAPDVAASPQEIPDVTVTAARPPTDEELAADSLSQFIAHHATVHYFNTGVTGGLARWLGGKRSICPLTKGLNPEQDDYVTARVRALAAHVGAPVQPSSQCEYNVTILFTNNPQKEMDEVFKWATVYFRNRYSGGMRDLIKFKSDHAIQGWYLMGGGLNNDLELAHLDVWPIWPQITLNYIGSGMTGTHFGGSSVSGIGVVILVIDTTKVVDFSIGQITDYLAMLALSVVQSPDRCDPLPSILDLMSPSCGTREMPTAITAGDLAFLKALYYKNTGLGRSLTRSQIKDNMMRQFRLR
jgi:hypothetical protein